MGRDLGQHQLVSFTLVQSPVPLSGCAQAWWTPPVAAALPEVECCEQGDRSQRPAGSAARVSWLCFCHALPQDHPRLKEVGRKAPLSMGGVCAVCGPLESTAGSRPYRPLNASSRREAAVGCDLTSWSLKSAGGFESCHHLPGALWSWEAIQSFPPCEVCRGPGWIVQIK